MRTSPPAGSARLRSRLHALVMACLERQTLRRSLTIALLAGTVLALPTYGPSLLASYVVLFGTALSTQVQGTRRREPSFTAARQARETGEE